MQRQTQGKSSDFVVVDLLDVDTTKISFMKPKQNNYGGQFIPIRYDGKSMFVRYESRTCPFGISTNTQKDDSKKYANDEKVTGYSTSISLFKNYETDPYYIKMRELDEFFIDKCVENSRLWGLGGSASRPISRDVIEGYDDKGADGKWKRLIKYAYKKNKKTGEREYQDYAPRLEFGIQHSSMEETIGSDGRIHQSAKFKPAFYNEDGEKIASVDTDNMSEVLPNWSKITVLAQWGSVTQGTYGASIKPKIQQVRIFPKESLDNDVCLLGGDNGGDEEDEDIDIPSMLDTATVRVMKVEEDEVADELESLKVEESVPEEDDQDAAADDEQDEKPAIKKKAQRKVVAKKVN